MPSSLAERAEAVGGIAALSRASRAIAAGEELQPTLEVIAGAAAQAAGAEVGVVWLRERDWLVVRAVGQPSWDSWNGLPEQT